MRFWAFIVPLVLVAAPAHGNVWEKFYTSFGPTDTLLPSTVAPEVVPSSGDIEKDVEAMWRRGFMPIGQTSFNTNNPKTGDAVKLAKKLKARYLIVATSLVSSERSSVPLTLPTSNTSQTSGTTSAYGSGGYASGTYSGTTTTSGTQTTYIPITIQRFDKAALYFMEVPKYGAGIMPRELTSDEIAKVETRRAFAVRFVRDASPAYYADLLPGDIVLMVNGQPTDEANWESAIRSTATLQTTVIRNGQQRDINITIPDDWRPR